jgi:hypothetical protein
MHRNFSHTQKIKENKKKKKGQKENKRNKNSFYFFSVFLSAKKYGALTLILDFVHRKISHMSLHPPGVKSRWGQCTWTWSTMYIDLTLTLTWEGVGTSVKIFGALSLSPVLVHRNF